MSQVIIFPQLTGGISVIHPSPNTTLSIHEIAAKDVPTGRPYLIIDHTDLPADREYRGAWEANFDTPDGVGATHGNTTGA